MVDFAKLRSITPAERAIADEELRNAEIIAERNERAALSKTTIKFTLAEDAELRSTMAGEKIVHLIGNTPDGRDARAVYKAPSYITESSVFRSEDRRVGKECVSTCRYRWSP